MASNTAGEAASVAITIKEKGSVKLFQREHVQNAILGNLKDQLTSPEKLVSQDSSL